MNCQELGSRLKTTNKLMFLWPGQGGNPPFDALALKWIYYNMMVDQWKISFLERGLDFSDPNYIFDAMIW